MEGDQVQAHFRWQGGNLVDTSVKPEEVHPRCYYVWEVWYERYFGDPSLRKHKAQHISCVNNLKQVGLAVRLWAGDNGDQYPFNVSTNQGGTKEWCGADAAGWDTNSWRHFQVMSNELTATAVLVCPQDRKRKAADWAALSAANVSYYFRANVTNFDSGTEILAACPADGNVVYADGHVAEKVLKKFKP